MEGTLFESMPAIYFLNLAATSTIVSIVGAVAYFALRQANLPLKHGVLCAALTFMLLSPLSVYVADLVGYGWITIPIDRGFSIEGGGFPYSSADQHDEFSATNAGLVGVLSVAEPARLPNEQLEPADVPPVDQQVPGMAPPPLSWADDLGLGSLSSVAELLAFAFLVIWGIGSFYLGCRLLYRIAAVARLKRSLRQSTSARLSELGQQAFHLLDLKHAVPIVESPFVPVPVTLGWINPVVGIPPELAQGLNDDELTSVFLHEAAHVGRRDQLISLSQHLATALYWWNPVLHWLNASICRVREQQCDDVTSLTQGSGVPLARSIVRVAEWAANKKLATSISVALLEDYRALEDRISRLTTDGRTIQTHLAKPSVVALSGLALGLAAISAIPLLNAFEIPSREFTQVSARTSETSPQDESQFTTDDTLSPEERHRKEVGIRITSNVPISVSGVVRSHTGQPVPNATVYLLSHYLTDKPLAETKTDAQGRYQFSKVPLPTLKSDEMEQPQGRFQTIATADGLGLAWHSFRQYMAAKRPDYDPVDPQSSTLYQDERVEMDMVMEPPTALRGQLVNEDGKPIVGAQLLLRELDYLNTENRLMSPGDRQCSCIVDAPAGYCETTTDQDGRFQFPNLPMGSVALLNIAHDDFAEQSLYVALTNEPITQYRYVANAIVGGDSDDDGSNFRPVHTPIWETRPVSTSPVTIQMRSARRVHVTLKQPDGKPAPKGTAVAASSGSRDQSLSSSGFVDENGQFELSLPPGDYVLLAHPPRYSNLRVSRTNLHVAAEPQKQEFTMEMAEGCVIQFEAIDAKTGQGIPGVTFTENIGNGTHQGLSNETTRVDYPVTDANGHQRAIAFAGIRRYQSSYAKGYVYDPKEIEVTCEPGKTVHIQFKLQPEK